MRWVASSDGRNNAWRKNLVPRFVLVVNDFVNAVNALSMACQCPKALLHKLCQWVNGFSYIVVVNFLRARGLQLLH